MGRKPSEFDHHPVPFLLAQESGYYRAHCRYVVDGDTADFLVDLGFFNYAYTTIRLAGIDTPEIRGVSDEEKARGLEAKDRVSGLILNQSVLLRSKEGRSFGRFNGSIFIRSSDFNIVDVDYNTVGPTRWYMLDRVLISEGHEK